MEDWKPVIVIPVFNHERAIAVIVDALLAYDLPIILVNDGSATECRQVLHALAERNPTVSVVDLPANRGKGGAVKAGLRAARERGYTHALQIDADGQHDSADVPQFLAAGLQQPASIIAGYPRYDASVPALRYYARYLTHVWIIINTLSFKIKDSMCGFRLYPLAAVCDLLAQAHTGERMDFDPEILVRWVWRGGDIVNVPTPVRYPLDGVSHFALWRDNWLISRMHARLFFGMLWRCPALLWRWIVKARPSANK